MSGLQIKKTMEQIHIPEEMQEQILLNVRARMESGSGITKRHAKNLSRRKYVPTFSWQKRAAVAAIILLAAGLVSIPVQALVQDFLTARMEAIPEEEVKDIAYLVQTQKVEVDRFSREFTESENKRMKELWQLYQNGIFPERTIFMAEYMEEAKDGVLCYIWENGLFCLPDRELTDEELLEIIDFNEIRQYAITHAGENVHDAYYAEQDRLAEKLAAAGGISRKEAEKIARNQMNGQLGTLAEGKIYPYISLKDLSEADYEHTGDVAYFVLFRDGKDNSSYTCEIDSADGSILSTAEYEPHGRRKGIPASIRERRGAE